MTDRGGVARIRHDTVAEALDDWHLVFAPPYQEDRTPLRHGSFSDSLALTHCICYGAAWRMLDYLLAHPSVYQRLSAPLLSDAPTPAESSTLVRADQDASDG